MPCQQKRPDELKIKTLLKWQNETKIRQRLVRRWRRSLIILVDKSETGSYSAHLSYAFSKMVLQPLCPGCRQECYNLSNTVPRQPFHSFPLLLSSAATQAILEDMFWYIFSPVSAWPNTNTLSHSPLSPHSTAHAFVAINSHLSASSFTSSTLGSSFLPGFRRSQSTSEPFNLPRFSVCVPFMCSIHPQHVNGNVQKVEDTPELTPHTRAVGGF